MYRSSIPKRVAESQILFPLSAVVATLLWWSPAHATSGHSIGGWALCMLTAYVLAETNNSNQLIRIRTRMVASVWLLLIGSIGLTHEREGSILAALCMAVSLYTLFRTYQLREPVTDAFHALLFASLAGMLVPTMLLLMPFYLWYLLVFMRVMSMRVLCASLIGMLLPHLFAVSYSIWQGDFSFYTDLWTELTTFIPIVETNYTSLTLQQAVSWGFASLIGLIGSIHYLFNYYNDKIKVRMLLYVFVFQFVLIEAIVLLQPQWLERMLAPMVVSASPIIAHYFALTNSWICTTLFLISIVAVITQTILTLWMSSMTF